jgi:hypothetical protein
MEKLAVFLFLMFPTLVSAHTGDKFHFHYEISFLVCTLAVIFIAKYFLKRKNEKIN